MFKRIPGTKDILPQEVSGWQEIEGLSRAVFSLYHYQEIRPPLIEFASLFDRSLGAFAEIVQKQMFLIKNQEDTYALRPEGTAAIVRAYIENSLDKTAGFLKLYYMGPMFRLERPQKGRLRQFHHIGCEAIGSHDPGVDVEVIALAAQLLKAFGIDGYRIKLNSLGCDKDKKELARLLQEKLQDKVDGLCEECRERFGHNILRILDCKKDPCRKIVSDLKLGSTYLCDSCAADFDAVTSGLSALNIPYEIVPHLVRGLDYYTRTVFEITHDALGAQDAIGAGGRYDNLVAELGGPEAGAIGFALGVERVLLARGSRDRQERRDLVYLIPLGAEAKKKSMVLLYGLRTAGIGADTDYEGKSLKGAMRSAHEAGARFAVIIGEDELKKGTAAVKDMVTSGQEEIAFDNLITIVHDKLAGN